MNVRRALLVDALDSVMIPRRTDGQVALADVNGSPPATGVLFGVDVISRLPRINIGMSRVDVIRVILA